MTPITRSLSTLLAGLCAAALLALPGAAQAKAFGPAEVLVYDCEYLGISVGKTQLMVGASTQMAGETVWPIMGLAKTDPMFLVFPLKDKMVTWWNPTSHSTVGNDLQAEEQGKRRKERVRFDRVNNKATTTREKEGEAKDEGTYDTLPSAQDILATFYALREQKLAVGDHVELPVFTGKRGFMLKVDVDRKEQVQVPAGKFDTVVLKVSVDFAGKLAAKREIFVYVTADERHVPVRIDGEFLLGTAAANLVSYQKGLDR